MAGNRRASANRQLAVHLTAVTAMLLGLVLVGIQVLPNSSLVDRVAASWGGHIPPQPTGSGDASTSRSTRPTPAPSPSLSPLPIQPGPVQIKATGWWGWSLLDTRTGKISGSTNQGETSTTASMIKAWISADYLRRTAADGRQPDATHLDMLTRVIRDSHNEYAEEIYNEIGRVSSIKRLIRICELTDSSPAPGGGWSRTELSPRDTARMGACIADGRAAGPKWTKWLLTEMRAVRGVGDFGIRKAFPISVRKTIAIKNGWVDRTAEQEYHVSCLAIGDGWTMGVQTRYPISLGYSYGAKTCQKVAEQLRVD